MARDESPAPLALTMGEPGGVGPELTASAWKALCNSGLSFFAIADPDLLNGADAPVKTIAAPEETHGVFAGALPVLPLERAVNATLGEARSETADAVTESIERAVGLALEGRASAVVTNPIQKSALQAAGFSFPGHTEFLQYLTSGAPMAGNRHRGAVMMLAAPQLKTVPVTIHLSVAEAAKSLRPDLIVDTALIVDEALRFDFGVEKPRLAISGLNPHAGEAGTMGAEDAMIIAPAVEELRAHGIDARGPLPADTMFHEEARAAYDAALCMLHDQALIPVKTLGFHDAVNVTLGLPIIRTSPDHGTALDIAGKGIARADSLIAALRLGADMAARRASQ